jgi:hypothetical protein
VSVRAYTADAVALLVYLVDALPKAADQVFAEAEAGETVIMNARRKPAPSGAGGSRQHAHKPRSIAG